MRITYRAFNVLSSPTASFSFCLGLEHAPVVVQIAFSAYKQDRECRSWLSLLNLFKNLIQSGERRVVFDVEHQHVPVAGSKLLVADRFVSLLPSGIVDLKMSGSPSYFNIFRVHVTNSRVVLRQDNDSTNGE